MKKIEIADLLNFRFPSAPTFSPNGKLAAFVVQTPSLEENKYLGDIWLLDVETQEVRQLTIGGDAKSFLWTEKGMILFPASRNPEIKDCTCFYEIDPCGGEAKLAFTVPVKGASLYPVDGDRYIVRAAYKKEKPEAGFTKAACDVLEETPFWANGLSGYTDGRRNRMYLFTQSTGELTPITKENFAVMGLSLLGSKALYMGFAWEGSRKGRQHPDLWCYDATTGENKLLWKAGNFNISDFALMTKNTAIISGYDDAGNNRMPFPDFYEFNLKTSKMTLLARLDAYAGYHGIASDARLGGGTGIKAVGDTLYFLTTDGDNGFLKTVDLKGSISKSLTPNGAADSFDVFGDHLLVCGMFGQKLSELYLNGKQVTHFNSDWLESHSAVPPKLHSFTDPDGFAIHGWAMKPVGYEPGKKYPAIVHIHGGPRTAFSDVYHHEMQVWANSGYFVLFCNPRGSDGRGSDFGFIQGLYGTVDYQNIMDFTDKMLEAYPDIDKSRVGVTGGSYGGFMTNWIIGHTNRFAAAVSQRSIANWVNFEHTSDIGYYFTFGQQGATTRENQEKLWEKSPLRYAYDCTTPTLFIHADEDYRCPISDGYSMFTALKKVGCDAKMVVFHGENHELSRSGKPANRLRRMEEILAWMDKYLK